MRYEVKTHLTPGEAVKFQEECEAFVKRNLIALVRELHAWDKSGKISEKSGFRVFSQSIKDKMGIPISVAMRVARGYVQDQAFEYLVRVADTQAMMKGVTALEGKKDGPVQGT